MRSKIGKADALRLNTVYNTYDPIPRWLITVLSNKFYFQNVQGEEG